MRDYISSRTSCRFERFFVATDDEWVRYQVASSRLDTEGTLAGPHFVHTKIRIASEIRPRSEMRESEHRCHSASPPDYSEVRFDPPSVQ